MSTDIVKMYHYWHSFAARYNVGYEEFHGGAKSWHMQRYVTSYKSIQK